MGPSPPLSSTSQDQVLKHQVQVRDRVQKGPSWTQVRVLKGRVRVESARVQKVIKLKKIINWYCKFLHSINILTFQPIKPMAIKNVIKNTTITSCHCHWTFLFYVNRTSFLSKKVSKKRRVYVELLLYYKCMKIQMNLFYYCITLYCPPVTADISII